MQDDDERCCGTGTCIIDPQGQCWCGQVWDGEKMCRPETTHNTLPDTPVPQLGVQPQTDRL